MPVRPLGPLIGGRRHRRLPVALLLVAGVLSACSSAASQPSAPTHVVATPPPAAGSAAASVGTLSLNPAKGPGGTRVTVRGSGLPAGAALQLVWHTVRGSWVLSGADDEVFQGRKFTPLSQVLSSVTTDAAGGFSAAFTVPEGFGFAHRVTLRQGGRTLDTSSFDVTPQLSVSPASGPLGTPIRVTLRGVGYQVFHNSWLLSYDNRFTGWMSSVTTGGTAVATIPATGGPGLHVLRIINGHDTFPYLNAQQAPPHNPILEASFTLTPGAPVLPAPAGQQGFAAVAGTAPTGSGPAIWVDPAQATVGTAAVVRGRGLPAGARLPVEWTTVVGNRVSGQGWQPASHSLGTAAVGADGAFSLPFRVPDDVGGSHAIDVRPGGGAAALTTSLTLTPSAYPLSPASGPAGTDVTIHVKGGGWTDTANIYTLVYDNAYLGYACAFNSQGDITVHLPATGAPGWHFIDLYPAIYVGTDAPQTDNFRIPQLTYARDHPGERLPAFHFAFRVTS